MSEDTEVRETAAQRRARERSERDNAERQSGDQPTPPAETWPLSATSEAELVARVAMLTPEELAATLAELSAEDQAKITGLPADKIAEARELAKIGGFMVTEAGDFRTATTPVRNRKPVQLAMDAVAEQAYTDWTDADRPSIWQRMPVITYFLDPDQVAEYRKLIRRACDVVNATSYEKDGKTVEPSGVRVRFGKEFVLSEKTAAKIGKPNEAGKTVLAWAAIDKRNVADRNGS